MNDEFAFLAFIREKPEDSARWLVYSDWLSEQGRDKDAKKAKYVGDLKLDTSKNTHLHGDLHTALFGQTLTECKVVGDEVYLATADGHRYRLYHFQSCCESVTLNDVAGDLNDLVGSPLLMAEETVSRENPLDYEDSGYQDSFTWTFYRFATVKGYVTLRWYGESNGYYSETVEFSKLD